MNKYRSRALLPLYVLTAAVLAACATTGEPAASSEPVPVVAPAHAAVLPPPEVQIPAAAAPRVSSYSHAPAAPPPPVPVPPARDTAQYASFSDNPWRRVAEQPVSTFSASVDTGSYANVRRFIARGQLPPKDAVRVEELVNYFGYDYAEPPVSQAQPFAVDARLSRSPWHAERGLLRIAIKARDLAKTSLPPANLVFLVDVSGSMSPQDRLPLVKSALMLLVQQLRPQDRLSIVSYANGTQLVLPATPGDRKTEIQRAIDSLSAGGATYGEAGIRMAYGPLRFLSGLKRRNTRSWFEANRAVYETEIRGPLKALVEEQRKAGVGLTTLGVGDSASGGAGIMSADKAELHGVPMPQPCEEAHKVLVNEMSSTLAVLAQDLKLQIEFNPEQVDEYRLIGYELNALTREQFNDDKVDAGDVGAGHTVTALYEIALKGSKGLALDPLRYGEGGNGGPAEASVPKAEEFAFLRLRYKAPDGEVSKLIETPLATARLEKPESSDADLDFAAAVAAFGQKLRGGDYLKGFTYDQIAALAKATRGADQDGTRAEFIDLVELAKALGDS